MNLVLRNFLFILASALAGFLSGFTLPLAYGARGAILGATISMGTLFLQPRRNRPAALPASPWTAIALSIAVTGAAVAAMALWHAGVPLEGQNMDFNLHTLSTSARLATCLSFALPLLLFYRERLAGRSRAWAWFFAAPFLGAATRSWGFHQAEAAPFTLVFGSLPFVALWWLSALLADPAWTPHRWARYTQPAGTGSGVEKSPL